MIVYSRFWLFISVFNWYTGKLSRYCPDCVGSFQIKWTYIKKHLKITGLLYIVIGHIKMRKCFQKSSRKTAFIPRELRLTALLRITINMLPNCVFIFFVAWDSKCPAVLLRTYPWSAYLSRTTCFTAWRGPLGPSRDFAITCLDKFSAINKKNVNCYPQLHFNYDLR